jgi:hypothetical protein
MKQPSLRTVLALASVVGVGVVAVATRRRWSHWGGQWSAPHVGDIGPVGAGSDAGVPGSSPAGDGSDAEVVDRGEGTETGATGDEELADTQAEDPADADEASTSEPEGVGALDDAGEQ